MSPRRRLTRHGLYAVKARVTVRGLQAIDRRSAAGRALVQWRLDLVADLGGEAAVSAQQRVLVDLAARTKLYVDSLDAWLLEQPSLVTRHRAVLPVLRERQQLADSLVRTLTQLGLERVAPPRKSWREVLAERAATTQHAAVGTTQPPLATEEPTTHAREALTDPCAAEWPSCEPSLGSIESTAHATHREHVPRDEPASDHPATSFPRDASGGGAA